MDIDVGEETPHPADITAERLQKLEHSVDLLLTKVTELTELSKQAPIESRPVNKYTNPTPVYNRNTNRPRGQRNKKPFTEVQYRWAADGRPICAKCDIPGHKAWACKQTKQAQYLN
jgi:hypothetical protein